MSKTTVVIKSDNFAAIAGEVRKRCTAAVEKATFDVEAQAKTLVPVDTGTLKNSIQSEFPGDLTGVVFTNVDYSIFVEYGTVRMSAQPYMTPALEKVRPQFIEAIRRLLG